MWDPLPFRVWIPLFRKEPISWRVSLALGPLMFIPVWTALGKTLLWRPDRRVSCDIAPRLARPLTSPPGPVAPGPGHRRLRGKPRFPGTPCGLGSPRSHGSLPPSTRAPPWSTELRKVPPGTQPGPPRSWRCALAQCLGGGSGGPILFCSLCGVTATSHTGIYLFCGWCVHAISKLGAGRDLTVPVGVSRRVPGPELAWRPHSGRRARTQGSPNPLRCGESRFRLPLTPSDAAHLMAGDRAGLCPYHGHPVCPGRQADRGSRGRHGPKPPPHALVCTFWWLGRQPGLGPGCG